MSKDFRQGFGIKARFDSSCRKGMAKRVKGVTVKTVAPEKPLIAHIKRMRFARLIRSPSEDRLPDSFRLDLR